VVKPKQSLQYQYTINIL